MRRILSVVHSVLLENALQHEILEHLKTLSMPFVLAGLRPELNSGLVEAGVLEQIDEVVKEQVTAELPQLIPQYMQDEVARHRKQLEEVQKALHNS